jgi:hypothetical protein
MLGWIIRLFVVVADRIPDVTKGLNENEADDGKHIF